VGSKDQLLAQSPESKAPMAGSESTTENAALGRELSTLIASNEFLSREIARLEGERDALSRELRYVKGGYSWKVIGGYRRWLVRYRRVALVRFCESLTTWLLRLTLGQQEQDPAKLYEAWIAQNDLTAERLGAIAATMAAFSHRPLISVYISVRAKAAEDLLRAAIDSVRGQLYQNWEVCIASDLNGEGRVADMLDTYKRDDPRIQDKRRADGELVVFLNQHGELSRDALFELAQQLNRNRGTDLIYWDEDRLDLNGTRCAPLFKPDWSPDLILSMNYVGQSFAVRKNVLEMVGGADYESYDLVLRASEHTSSIVHIPKILYHQREMENPPDDVHAIEEALRRRSLRGKVVAMGRRHYSVRYEILDNPMVSILIPTRDKRELLEKCIDTILEKTDYTNYEIIILDNDSSEPETFKYFRQISDQARTLGCPGPFNFSAINNRGVAAARGDLLLFLNNDTEVISPHWMRALIEQAQRPEVGAVGAKLLFRDGRIQHAGVILGIDGLVLHAFGHLPDDAPDSPVFANVIRDCSAVTGACMMMRRSLFDEVGGFDERLPENFNDIDLCLRLRQRGYLIVYTPLAFLYHHERSSRRGGRAQPYLDIFMRRWGAYIKAGDPYYNRNLTLAKSDWSVAI
jgi:O-antigen biosynthesis protein